MHKMSCFIKGTLVGFAVGAAVGVMTDPLSDRERRKISKKTEGIFRNIGSVMDNIIAIYIKLFYYTYKVKINILYVQVTFVN